MDLNITKKMMISKQNSSFAIMICMDGLSTNHINPKNLYDVLKNNISVEAKLWIAGVCQKFDLEHKLSFILPTDTKPKDVEVKPNTYDDSDSDSDDEYTIKGYESTVKEAVSIDDPSNHEPLMNHKPPVKLFAIPDHLSELYDDKYMFGGAVKDDLVEDNGCTVYKFKYGTIINANDTYAILSPSGKVTYIIHSPDKIVSERNMYVCGLISQDSLRYDCLYVAVKESTDNKTNKYNFDIGNRWGDQWAQACKQINSVNMIDDVLPILRPIELYYVYHLMTGTIIQQRIATHLYGTKRWDQGVKHAFITLKNIGFVDDFFICSKKP